MFGGNRWIMLGARVATMWQEGYIWLRKEHLQSNAINSLNLT